MAIKVILNPYSNRWRARERWPQAEAALKAAGLQVELSESQYAGHSRELAAEFARAGTTTVIAAGGDGTVGDVINGLLSVDDSPGRFTLGIVPLGTANDLVCNLGLPLDLGAAAGVIAAGSLRPMDVGCVNGKYFGNNSAIGLEPTITTIQERITAIRGIMRYLAATLTGIMRKPSWQAGMNWDDGSFEGPVSLVSVCNGRRTGGLFFMAPHADPFDGRLTFSFGYRATRLGLLAILPRTMKPDKGSFVEAPGMHEVHATRLEIHLDRPSPYHTDGELLPELARDFSYRILPGQIKVILPAA